MLSQHQITQYLMASSRSEVKIATAARELDLRGIFNSVEKAEAVAQKLAKRYGLNGGHACGELRKAAELAGEL